MSGAATVTGVPFIDAIVDYLMDYESPTLPLADEWSSPEVAMINGLEFGIALAMRHPEYAIRLARLGWEGQDSQIGPDEAGGLSEAIAFETADILVERFPITGREIT